VSSTLWLFLILSAAEFSVVNEAASVGAAAGLLISGMGLVIALFGRAQRPAP
jgi:hypothetical protein